MEDKDLFQMLLSIIEKASQRTRWIFSLSIVVSFSQLGADFNFAYGFMRTFVKTEFFQKTTSLSNVVTEGNGGELFKELQKSLIRSWVDQLSININIIGIKFSVADISLIGSIALLIISIWHFYSARRENHLIGKTCMLAKDKSASIKKFLFLGISGSQMFGTLTKNDEPISSLKPENDITLVTLRPLLYLLFFLPAVTVIFTLVTDILSIFYFSAVFRGVDYSLFEYYNKLDGTSLKELLIHMSPIFLFQFVILLVLSHILYGKFLTKSEPVFRA